MSEYTRAPTSSALDAVTLGALSRARFRCVASPMDSAALSVDPRASPTLFIRRRFEEKSPAVDASQLAISTSHSSACSTPISSVSRRE